MIIWLNGTFGAGKTTTARHLAGRLDNARHFDPELVGYLYEKSRPWMESAADLVIDSTNLPAADVAERIAAEAGKRIAEADQARA